jgi:hypothetical protein
MVDVCRVDIVGEADAGLVVAVLGLHGCVGRVWSLRVV